ncbi:dTDP-4-dehydrorhamnose 3,5-epimerase [Amycolatopsis sp. SID8362]|uniref:dTDP-4-dehydrorhamnose 3,5-epimerase family protein n=1 Tax=Amycolatopsis sp. SID8362 TaxID=2690346 RepID=UPI0013702D53|nr:dTDP-4-dehydrorhamnose 3,5-epimerase [Amycolatopsis sp. SID8362]NBH09622.1 dTDP-4-dehydrorhamnose 3,5-epimerase [Amycolatopsis sp. SID8362]NED46314.1 dTDP-4-keto-6-deoxy-D-glucose epimerase [Amycolatopsis sp. SID8362]
MGEVREARELAVPGAFEFGPRVFPDERGLFVCPFQEAAFVEAVGHPLKVAQLNHSRSRRGTIRGLHYADVPPGQGKYVYCSRGALLDVVADIRVGSPTFGVVDAVRLDPLEFRAVYVPEGLGHAIMALEDDTVLSYLCTTEYDAGREHGLDPLDPELGLPWPSDVEPLLSPKDRAAPRLAEALAAGLLPRYEECVAHYRRLRENRVPADSTSAH